ncbi:MAG: hypothetical protein H6582_07725 [Crocinitomicaceae bacterium]|nr:hypothetical protein [Crocinitomicaceae bacterium]
MKKISLISLLILIVSCNKGTINYDFSGIVLENVNNTAVSGASVKMYQIPFNSSLTSNNYEFAGGATTEANGLYQFSFDRIKATKFKMEITKENYFDHSEEINAEDVTSDHINIYNSTLESKSWITFDINNLAPANANDELQLIFFNYRTGCDGCVTADYYYFNGLVDTSFTITNTAGSYFRFMKVNVNVSQSSMDSVYLVPFDTAYYQINY